MSADNNRNRKLKLALLSAALVSASLNAITGMIPEMAKAFPGVSLSTIELITTIPSLFQMAGIGAGKAAAEKIGHKYTAVAGLLLCGLGGILPFFLPLFPVILVTRCLFGLGSGMLNASQLVLIIHFFTGNTRSAVIGLNGTFGGLGSALCTFIAGQLLVFGWNASFAVYSIGLVFAAVFLFCIPNTAPSRQTDTATDTAKTTGLPPGLFGLALLSFTAVLLATFSVIKASTLITESGFGSAADGSTALSVLSIGSLLAGLTYGRIRSRLGNHALTFFFAVCLAGNVVGGLAENCTAVFIGAFLLGYGYIGFVPFIQEEASRKYGHLGQRATNTVLVFQSLGAFFTPYICPVFQILSGSLRHQFFIVAGLYGVLCAAALVHGIRTAKNS